MIKVSKAIAVNASIKDHDIRSWETVFHGWHGVKTVGKF